MTSSTVGWGRGCNIFFPVVGGNDTKTAPTGDVFDQLLSRMRSIRGKLADHVGDHVVSSPEGAVLVTSPGTKSLYPRRLQSLNSSDVENISPRITAVRAHTGETSGSSLVQRQKDALMVPNPRENSQGGRRFREKYTGKTSATKTEIPAEIVERSCMQECPHSLLGSVPSGPPDRLVREPLCQEDTCRCSEHTTSHQKQSRISELNRIWNDRKSLLADSALSLEDKQNVVVIMARTVPELVLINDGKVGDVATGLGGTRCYQRSMPMTPNTILGKSRDFRGFQIWWKISITAYRWLRKPHPPTLNKRCSMETTAAYKSIGSQYGKSCVKMSDETDAWFSPGKSLKQLPDCV